jgi:hypothetical protein
LAMSKVGNLAHIFQKIKIKKIEKKLNTKVTKYSTKGAKKKILCEPCDLLCVLCVKNWLFCIFYIKSIVIN